ncbi:hypothetical protein F4775DRAFT_595243 [Biscogniauxia sp. FL1348]|nr:hypothetical protein F4775DRAFT_595243 [Biscogniauxia sp. FL1348]
MAPSPPPPTPTTTLNTSPTAIRAFEPESLPAWSHFTSIPWCAALLSRPDLRPYTADLPVPTAAADPVLSGILARPGAGGVLHHVSLLAGGTASFPHHFDLYTLGPALAGAPLPPALHGGVLCLLVDAACGRVGFMHRFCGTPCGYGWAGGNDHGVG